MDLRTANTSCGQQFAGILFDCHVVVVISSVNTFCSLSRFFLNGQFPSYHPRCKDFIGALEHPGRSGTFSFSVVIYRNYCVFVGRIEFFLTPGHAKK